MRHFLCCITDLLPLSLQVLTVTAETAELLFAPFISLFGYSLSLCRRIFFLSEPRPGIKVLKILQLLLYFFQRFSIGLEKPLTERTRRTHCCGAGTETKRKRERKMVLGIEFAPLKIPLKRRLQTSAVILFICLFLLGHTVSWIILLAMALIPVFTPFAVAYLFWVFKWDKNTPFQGGRPFGCMKRWKAWEYFRDYFPISLRREVPLDPKGTYLFGCHPHGLASMGAVCNFMTDATGFSEKFPGVDMRLLTLDVQFEMPIWRDLLMAQGMASVSKQSCLHCLNNNISIAIVIGGAAEALDARPGSTELTLAGRRGFIKMAMYTG